MAARREELGLLQVDVARLLAAEGVKITQKGISKWERDVAIPDARQFLALCKVLEIRDVMEEFMDIHYNLLSGLNKEGRARVIEYAQILRESERFGTHENPAPTRRMIRLYDLPVSAGPGTFLDGESFELIELPEDAPNDVGYALKVSGTSMEPHYRDGQIIWVKEQNSLMPGEIGVFVYDGCSYVKQLIIDDRGVVLHSLNPEKEDILVSHSLLLRVMGRVLPSQKD